jgi:hypothetical protein
MPAVAKRRLMQVTKQLGSASGRSIQFFGCLERPSSGHWLQSLHRERNTTPRVGREVAPFQCVKRGGNYLGDQPLRTDGAILMLRFGNGTNGNLWKFFKILKQKMY